MIAFDAIYYDGRTSVRNPVRVRAGGELLHIAGASLAVDIPLVNARVDPPLPGMPRALRFGDGASLHTDDEAAVDALFPSPGPVDALAQALERRWLYALCAIGVVDAFGAWCIVYGLPLAAAVAARFVPQEAERSLGEHALATVDRTLCRASASNPVRREAVLADFRALTAGTPGGDHYRLELRQCRGMGPNAFALPGGIVVVTDELLRVLPDDAQVSAVLAHEIGHVAHRHALRGALQAAGAAALVSAVAGDAVSITSLATTLPTLLFQRGYSLSFEDEADAFAFVKLKQIGLSPRTFAEALTALERAHPASQAGPKSAMDYLSTHPATARRIARALKAD